MTANFEERPEVVFRGIVALLTGDIDFIIDR